MIARRGNLPKLWSNILIHTPIGFGRTISDTNVKLDVRDRARSLEWRPASHKWPKGKTLGGSSLDQRPALYSRPARDYDGWRQMGCEGWGYQDVKPYFRAL